jgi:hypothetical protein
MQFPKLLSFSNALNGMKRRESGYNLQTGMLPNFGKPAAGASSETTSVSLVSTVSNSVFSRLKKCVAVAKRVLLKPEEPQPFAAPQEKKSYQVFRRLPAHDEVRHVAAVPQIEPTAEVLTDNQGQGNHIKPTLWDKLSGLRGAVVVPETSNVAVSELQASKSEFKATCPGRAENNPIADAYEKRMAEKKAAAPVVVKLATPVIHSAARPEVKQSVPAKLREAIFGRKRTNAQPVVQGELALENVRPIRNDLSDADLEVVSAVAKVGTGNQQTATAEKASTTVTSLRESKKTDSAINSAAEAPHAESTPELIARV